MTDVVVAQGLVREFAVGDERIRAVDGIDITVAAGELLMVLGRSGAGKTTLLSLVGGLDRPDAGSVLVSGQRVDELTDNARDHFLQVAVGWVFQTSGLVPLLSAAENVELSLRLAGVVEGEIAGRALDALSRVGLRDRAAHTAAELSGGEQQRVAVARAVAKQPTLLVADEPTAQLNSETAAGITQLLREVAAAGTAVLMATHDRAAVDAADRVVAIQDGRLVVATT